MWAGSFVEHILYIIRRVNRSLSSLRGIFSHFVVTNLDPIGGGGVREGVPEETFFYESRMHCLCQ